MVLADCDVDAADLHLLLNPTILEKNQFKSGNTAKIDYDLCEKCDKCIKVCRFSAITKYYVVDPVSCEGCGVCYNVCPAGAVIMEENLSGEWFMSDTKYGPMVHAKLGIAEENSGKLVTLVKKKAKEIAEREKKDFLIVDGPPGIGCPVIASLANADLALIVTEPTLSGIHDMERVAELARHFSIPIKVVINKFDINEENTGAIEKFCHEKDIEVLAKLPFSESVVKSLVNKVPIVEFCDDRISKEIALLWKKI